MKDINRMDQKVELIEQNLRMYTGYWLEACNNYLE